MVQSITTPLTRQLVTYRHQALAAPTMLDEGTLAPSHVAGSSPTKAFKVETGFFLLISPCGPFCSKCSAPMAPAERRSVACALG